jgi:bifunctional DNA primase/polymerase-like protein
MSMQVPGTVAVNAIALGLPVFPCGDDKSPKCPSGFKDAVTDPDAVHTLFRRFGGTLAGVPTGKASGIDVLDLDPDKGSDPWLAAHRHLLPLTRMHRTRSGGLHILFQSHEGMRNSVGKTAPGVDTRGGGGYIIWWPASGMPVLNPDELAIWPEWLLERVLPRRVSRPEPPIQMPRGGRYAAAALHNASMRVATAPVGQRNAALNRETWSVTRFIRSGELSAFSIAQRMTRAGLAVGLDAREIEKTVASALRAGMAS